MADYQHDSRIVLTLDAGGTSFRFGARQGGAFVTETIVLPTNGDNLKLCLGNIVQGFKQVLALCPAKPVAISFAFPGPADYSRGIIGDLPNLPAFRGGIALGDMLQEKFHLPVFINNDGDLFAYGEAIAGFLPYVNGLLEKAGSPKRYKNLIGMTLGTGLGGGLARAGELFDGDNSVAAQFHLFRHKFNSQMSAEEGACIRAVRRTFAELAGIPLAKTPDPRVIADIAAGRAPGHQAAAIRAYQQLGLVAGDALANALAMVDGLAVIGGGISQAWPLFLPALVDELNGTFVSPEKVEFHRLSSMAFNLEDKSQLKKFLRGKTKTIKVPDSRRKIKYDALPRIGIGISRLGTSTAIAMGAQAFALQSLDGVRLPLPR